jgi:hypothetical protein
MAAVVGGEHMPLADFHYDLAPDIDAEGLLEARQQQRQQARIYTHTVAITRRACRSPRRPSK